MPLSSGELLEHRYEIVAILEQDESGISCLGRDLRIVGRAAVIKESLDLSPEAQGEFMKQFAILIMPDHPNLVHVSDGIVSPNRGKYMIMDYVKGETLEDIVGERGPLPEGEVIATAQQLLIALHYLHNNSVVRRNVTPTNIVIKPDGKAVLVDYGTSSRKGVVREEVLGTPGFAAIEQQYGGPIDARSDLYSLGAVMYYLLTGLIPPAAPNLVLGDSILIPHPSRGDGQRPNRRGGIILAQRREVLQAPYAGHPDRFVKRLPVVSAPPNAVWINQPKSDSAVVP